MEIKKVIHSAAESIKKYKHAVLVVIIGLILMAIPSIQKSDQTQVNTNSQEEVTQTVETRLADTLSRLNGAGEVHVMLSVKEGEKTLYQMNTDRSESTDSNNIREDTVILSDASRNEQGLVHQILPEQFQGAIILCTGADDPSVRLAIVDAVSKITGLSSNHISVLKMK